MKKKSGKFKKISDQEIHDLEDKRMDLICEGYQKILSNYRKKLFWPSLFAIGSCWLIFPVVAWSMYRKRTPEWKELKIIETEMEELRGDRNQRNFWAKMGQKKNVIRSENMGTLKKFYETLIQSSREYNARTGLLEFTLDRQSKELDEPFKPEELEQIQQTLQRIYDEIRSSMSLLTLAEQNPHMDLMNLIEDEYKRVNVSSEYVSKTMDLGNSGKFIQDLLILETNLRSEISGMSATYDSAEKDDSASSGSSSTTHT